MNIHWHITIFGYNLVTVMNKAGTIAQATMQLPEVELFQVWHIVQLC